MKHFHPTRPAPESFKPRISPQVAEPLDTHRYPQWFRGVIIAVSRKADFAYVGHKELVREDGSAELGIPAPTEALFLHICENRVFEPFMTRGTHLRFRVAPGNHPRRRHRLIVIDAQPV